MLPVRPARRRPATGSMRGPTSSNRAATILALTTLLVATLLVTAGGPPAGAASGRRTFLVNTWSATSVRVDQPVVVQGQVKPAAAPGRRRVFLQVRQGKRWTTVQKQKAGSSGRYAFRVATSAAGTRTFRTVAPATSGARYGTSRAKRVTVSRYRSALGVRFPGGSAKLGTKKNVSGRVRPVDTDRAVRLQRKVPGGWATMSTAVAKAGGRGRFSLRLPTTTLAHLRLRVAVAGTRRDAAAARGKDKAFRVAPTWNAAGRPRDHRFLRGHFRWNPCRTIDYRVNDRRALPGAVSDVKTAIRRLRQATGLPFRYRGRTRVVPQSNPKQKYPSGTELVIAWTSQQGSSLFHRGDTRNGIAGRGGSLYYYSRYFVDGAGHHVAQAYKGRVVLNTAFNRRIGRGEGRGPTRVELLMHELGHVVGLDHTRARSQIMYADIGRPRDLYGAGDLAGLESRGFTGGCLRRAPSAGREVAGAPAPRSTGSDDAP